MLTAASTDVRRPRGAEPPVDPGKFVDQVTGLLAEQPGDAYLILAQEMEAHPRSALGDPEGVVDLRDAHEEVRGIDAALGHEPGEAAAHFGIGCPDGDHEVRVVDQL